jgi:dihydrodipicolinate synthase/N-acetylneuraminate lyase
MCVEAYEASRAGDSARAVSVQKRLVTAASLFGPKYGNAGLKYVMDCVGYYGGPPRPPLLPVDDAAKRELDAMLASVVSEAVAGD